MCVCVCVFPNHSGSMEGLGQSQHALSPYWGPYTCRENGFLFFCSPPFIPSSLFLPSHCRLHTIQPSLISFPVFFSQSICPLSPSFQFSYSLLDFLFIFPLFSPPTSSLYLTSQSMLFSSYCLLGANVTCNACSPSVLEQYLIPYNPPSTLEWTQGIYIVLK